MGRGAAAPAKGAYPAHQGGDCNVTQGYAVWLAWLVW